MSSGQQKWVEEAHDEGYRNRLARVNEAGAGKVLGILEEVEEFLGRLDSRDATLTRYQVKTVDDLRDKLRKRLGPA